MFRRYRVGRREGGIILCIKEYIQAYEIKLERGPNCNKANSDQIHFDIKIKSEKKKIQ